MQNSHSDVQQSSYRCINHGTHTTGQSSKRFLGAASDLGHWEHSSHGHMAPLPPRSCQPGTPTETGSTSRAGLEGLEQPGHRDRAGGCRHHTGTALSSPLPHSIHGFSSLQKKNKAPAKNVINIRANCEEFGQSHGSAASTQNQHCQPGGDQEHRGDPTSDLLPAPAQGGSAFLPLFLGSSKFSPNQTTCQLTKPFVLL